MHRAILRWVVTGVTVEVALLAGCVSRADFYVAPTGNDAWSGTLADRNANGGDGPFATISRTRDAVRSARQREAGPYTVLIRGGVYRLAEPIVFTPADSRAPAAEITYAAYPGEKPIFSGGRVINGRTRSEGSIWTTLIPEVEAGTWDFSQLFRQWRASHPCPHAERRVLPYRRSATRN